MDTIDPILLLALIALVAAVFAARRLCRWMEARGWLYPDWAGRAARGSGPSLFIFHKLLDPKAEQIEKIKEERRLEEVDPQDKKGGGGPGPR